MITFTPEARSADPDAATEEEQSRWDAFAEIANEQLSAMKTATNDAKVIIETAETEIKKKAKIWQYASIDDVNANPA